MGIVLVEYILHALVHSFDWKLPYRVVELNMDESFGLFFFLRKESFGLTLQNAMTLSTIVCLG